MKEWLDEDTSNLFLEKKSNKIVKIKSANNINKEKWNLKYKLLVSYSYKWLRLLQRWELHHSIHSIYVIVIVSCVILFSKIPMCKLNM